MNKDIMKTKAILWFLSISCIAAMPIPVSAHNDRENSMEEGIAFLEYKKGDSATEIDDTIFKIMEKFKVAGISAAAVKGNEICWSGAYGWHDIEKQTLLRKDSILRIASLSKSFTSLAIMQLVERGKIDLDEDIDNYLAHKIDILRASTRNPKHPDIPITTRQLLNHTSSITNGKYVEFNTAYRQENRQITLDDYFGENGEFYDEKNWADYAPGEEFEYSNMAYVVLGAIVESVSGQRFDRYVRQNVFEPLKMNNTSFNIDDLDPDQVTPMYKRNSAESGAVYFTKTTLKPFTVHEEYISGTHGGFFGPQGGLLSTAEDLARFMIAMMQENENILSKNLHREMHRVSVKTDKQGPSTFWGIYKRKGLGIHITDEFIQNRTMYGHSGSAYGIITALYYTKDVAENSGIAFLINGCNEEIQGKRSPYYAIEEELAEWLDKVAKDQR